MVDLEEVDLEGWEAVGEEEVMADLEMSLETHLILPLLSDLCLQADSEETRQIQDCGTSTLMRRWAPIIHGEGLAAHEGEAATLREVDIVEAAHTEVAEVDLHRA